MQVSNRTLGTVCAASLMLAAYAGSAAAGSLKDEAAPAEREFSWSVNIGGTTDYVFRGISQTLEDPAAQGGVDIGYGIFYAGAWASRVDFVAGNPPPGNGDATIEVDLYAGITPTWGPLTFDLGVIYYAYPGAQDLLGQELEYVELKMGVSGSIQDLELGFTAYYSPDYFAGTGDVWTLEGSASYTLPQVWIFTPSISGVVGTSLGDWNGTTGFNVDGFGDDSYVYWNAGLSLGIEKLTLDFRYWDTDIGTVNNGFCVTSNLCDSRFVFSAKVDLP